MRERGAAAVLGLSLGLAALSARADAASIEAKLRCEPALSVGRVRCALEVAAPPGARLAWVDALVLETPTFARALRTRVAQPLSRNQSKAELLLGLVASAEGTSVLRVKARAVICPSAGNRRCRAVARVASVALEVGAGRTTPGS